MTYPNALYDACCDIEDVCASSYSPSFLSSSFANGYVIKNSNNFATTSGIFSRSEPGAALVQLGAGYVNQHSGYIPSRDEYFRLDTDGTDVYITTYNATTGAVVANNTKITAAPYGAGNLTLQDCITDGSTIAFFVHRFSTASAQTMGQVFTVPVGPTYAAATSRMTIASTAASQSLSFSGPVFVRQFGGLVGLVFKRVSTEFTYTAPSLTGTYTARSVLAGYTYHTDYATGYAFALPFTVEYAILWDGTNSICYRTGDFITYTAVPSKNFSARLGRATLTDAYTATGSEGAIQNVAYRLQAGAVTDLPRIQSNGQVCFDHLGYTYYAKQISPGVQRLAGPFKSL